MAELSSQPTSVQTIYSWYTQDKLHVNRRYQRKLVWTLEEKQRLVESILKKYPVPAILVAERKDVPGTYEIIDGLQRLHAIVAFIETSYPTLDGKYFAIEHFPTAKARADSGAFEPQEAELISQEQVSILLDYSLALSVMRGATDAEVDDVFGRINTYGHRLSDQERRQAGVQNEFSEMVRDIACTIRGDTSADVLPLKQMPSISIDLPMTKHGYEVDAEEVVWVAQGILRSTELRDSLDEQCIADIAACILGGTLIERSKDALDEIYESGSDEAIRINAALDVYGAEKFSQEFKYCLDEILAVCSDGQPSKLRDLLFSKRTTNSFPAVFAVLMLAFHELIVKDGNVIGDYAVAKAGLNNLNDRIETSRKSTSPEERRKNINTIKGLISAAFVKADISKKIYANHSTIDIDSTIRRSEIETSSYELKQGLLTLDKERAEDKDLLEKVLRTVCAIANNGPGMGGTILIGVADKPADAARVEKLDGVKPIKVGRRHVVGVAREAAVMGLSVEEYFTKWRDVIAKSPISDPLRASVLASLDFNSYYGLGIVAVTIPAQTELAYFDGRVFVRQGDATIEVTQPKDIAGVAKRF